MDIEKVLKEQIAKEEWREIFDTFWIMGKNVFDKGIDWRVIEEWLVGLFPMEMEAATRRLWRAALHDAVMADQQKKGVA